MGEMTQLQQRINARIRAHEARLPHRAHFTPHYPLYHDRPFKLDCWCGQLFTSTSLDMREFARMIDWINEHSECEAR